MVDKIKKLGVAQTTLGHVVIGISEGAYTYFRDHNDPDWTLLGPTPTGEVLLEVTAAQSVITFGLLGFIFYAIGQDGNLYKMTSNDILGGDPGEIEWTLVDDSPELPE